MEATVLSVGKAVLDGTLGYAKSTASEEMALQLGVEHDVGFITDELEMMQSFLMTADLERGQDNKVLTTWVKQVREMAYNVEDSLVDFAIHAENELPPFLGCLPFDLFARRRIAMEVKELKAKVEDVSNRKKRYHLNKLAAFGVEQGRIAAAAAAAGMFGTDKALRVTEKQDIPQLDLDKLLISEEVDLRTIAVWGTSGDLGKTSEIWKAYDDPNVKAMFGCRAWVRLLHPFDPKEFLHSLVRQFYATSQEQESSKAQEGTTVGGNVLLKMDKMGQSDLVHVYHAQVSSNSYLIVIDGLSAIDEWDNIKTYFPNNKNGSRIVVATQQYEVASLCTEQPHQVSELKQLSSAKILYLFHKKVEKTETNSKSISKSAVLSSTVTSLPVCTNEIEQVDHQARSVDGGNVVAPASMIERRIDRSKTRAVIPDDIIVGRGLEEHNIIGLIGHPDGKCGFRVISIWGMGGIGKTTLVRSIYRSQQLGGWKRAWATVLHPFNLEALVGNLILQLIQDSALNREKENNSDRTDGDTKEKSTRAMTLEGMITKLHGLLERQNCLVVIDDLSSAEEWDFIEPCLVKARCIIATTREKFVAKYCSKDDPNMIYWLQGLSDDAALDLFTKKVFKNAAGFCLHSGMLDQAKLILNKCDGLPLAISTIGSYLTNKPKTAMEWRKLNDGLSAELEINPELKMIKTILMRSYEGLPYHLKACFLYLSVFPEDHKIQRKHLVRRWVAEGYAREMHHMKAEQVGYKHFEDLIERSMTLPLEEGTHGSIDSCQLHDLIREICMSKAREENLVFTLEEGCSVGGSQGAIRHLAISSNWKRDEDVMQKILDLSHTRSLTVFGEWRSFFISNKMRFLRVLDLEGTVGLRDHHLDQIGELLHLRYLSLRGCKSILVLPDTLANLRQLQTLDVRGTRIWSLPTAVTKLQKLQYLHAPGLFSIREEWTPDDVFGELRSTIQCKTEDLLWMVAYFVSRHLFLTPLVLEASLIPRSGPHPVEDGVSSQDLCNLVHYYIMHKNVKNMLYGVKVPRGISKLKALHTLRVVNAAWGETTFQELGELSHLRKLGVTGIISENNERFWSAIAGHKQLKSLSVQVGCNLYKEKQRNFANPLSLQTPEMAALSIVGLLLGPPPEKQVLDGCLDWNLCPPLSLESLKVRGKLDKVTEWIYRLDNLSKLQLEETEVGQDALRVIGKLPNLAVLRLMKNSCVGKQLLFEASYVNPFGKKLSYFPNLLVLQFGFSVSISCTTTSVEFEPEAVPKLEMLQGAEEFHGLEFITSLKEVRLKYYAKTSLLRTDKECMEESDRLEKGVRRQLMKHPNNVTMKLL